jgi:hypothetical protein
MIDKSTMEKEASRIDKLGSFSSSDHDFTVFHAAAVRHHLTGTHDYPPCSLMV